MPRPRPTDPQRLVYVNVKPEGRIHEEGCRWMETRLANHPDVEPDYVPMPAAQAPPDKVHCSHC